MHTFAEKPNTSWQPWSGKSKEFVPAHFKQNPEVSSTPDSKRLVENQGLYKNTSDVTKDPTAVRIPRFDHNFSRIPVHAGKTENLRSESDSSPQTDAYKDGLDSSTRSDAQIAAGYQPDASEDSVLGGEPGGEAAAEPQTAPLGGVAASISTKDNYAPEWKNNGQFKWWIEWVTDGKSGWIVQKVENSYSGTRADGTAITNASLGAEPLYYEAWQVAGTGAITPPLDMWQRPALGALGSQTSFSMKGTVYWTSKDPALSGFTPGGVGNAGILLSSKSAPADIGSSLLSRSAHGTWAKDGTPALPGCFTT